MPVSTRIERMTWPEVKAALNAGYTSVILPAGSIEQHGPHLPLNTDTIIAETVADAVAQRLGGTLTAPAIRPGLSAHHMAFPGTITLSGETFSAAVCDTVSSLAQHGFKTVFLLSGHGGNFSMLERIASEPPEGYIFPELIVPPPPLDKYIQLQQQFVWKQFGIEKDACAYHADFMETSLMLFIRPRGVRRTKMEPGFRGDFLQIIDTVYGDGIAGISENGVLGDPSSADREAGKQLLELITGIYTDHFTKAMGASITNM